MGTYLSKVNKLRQAANERAQQKNCTEVQPIALSDEPPEDAAKLRYALEKLQGRDRVGVAGEAAAVAGSAAAGAAVAGSVAGAAGATTLLGSTTLAGMLGGVFVTATPVGWILGSAVVAGALGYGAAKMMRSGGKQDHVRADLRGRLSDRLLPLEKPASNVGVNEFRRLLQDRLESGAITPDAARRVSMLVDQGRLDLDLAVRRISAISIEPGSSASL